MIEFKEVHSDERRTIFVNNTLLKDKEISIIKLKKGKAIGGCLHNKDEYYCILSGCVMVMNGVENIISMDGDSGIFRENTPHAFIAEEDSIIIEWGISPEDKKNNPKDEEMLNRIKEFNSLRWKYIFHKDTTLTKSY